MLENWAMGVRLAYLKHKSTVATIARPSSAIVETRLQVPFSGEQRRLSMAPSGFLTTETMMCCHRVSMPLKKLSKAPLDLSI